MTSKVPLLTEVDKSAETLTWIAASRHSLGAGLQSGAPSLEPALRARADLAKERAWAQVRALDRVVCGGAWQDFAKECLCGRLEDARHCFWTCPVVNANPHPDIQKSNNLGKLFGSAPFAQAECLWGRALLPASWLPPTCEIIEAAVETSPNFESVASDTGCLYPDGSGGMRARRLLRPLAGSGAAALRVTGDEADGSLQVREVLTLSKKRAK